jgi:hypothetical protein
MKEIKIKVFGDPGHAWARFPKARLVKLGIADKITPYSGIYDAQGRLPRIPGSGTTFIARV